MQRAYEALIESTVIMGTAFLMFSGTACYMWGTGREVPEALVALIGLLGGFWLRSKASTEVKKAVE